MGSTSRKMGIEKGFFSILPAPAPLLSLLAEQSRCRDEVSILQSYGGGTLELSHLEKPNECNSILHKSFICSCDSECQI